MVGRSLVVWHGTKALEQAQGEEGEYGLVAERMVSFLILLGFLLHFLGSREGCGGTGLGNITVFAIEIQCLYGF